MADVSLVYEAQNQTRIFFLVFFIMFVSALLIVIFVLLGKLFDRLGKRKIEAQSNSIRVFKINMNNNSVEFFNIADIKNRRTIDLSQFYSQFLPSEQDKVKRWLRSQLDTTKSKQDFLEVDVNINKYKRPYFSLLKFVSADPATSIIHIESYILKYISGKNGRKNRVFSTIEDVSSALLHSSPSRGTTFGIKFYNLRTQTRGEEGNYLVYSQLKDIATQFVTSNRYLLNQSNSELTLIDTKIANQDVAISLEKSIAESFKKFLTLNSYATQIGFSFSIVENKLFPRDAEKLIAQAKKLALIASEDGDEYRWYDKGARIDDSSETGYHSEVTKVINEKLLRFLFRPIVNAIESKTIGYFANAIPMEDSTFENIDDLKEYAKKSEDAHLLFSWVAKNVIPTFVNEKDGSDLRLFLNVSIDDKLFISKSLGHLTGAKDAKIVLQFEETDLLNYSDGEENLIKDLFSFLEKGYGLSLLLNNKEPSLSFDVMSRFSYFVFDAKNIDIRSDTRARLRIVSNAGKLLKYNRPIIITNIESWSSIELIIRNGISYVSSDTILPLDEMVKPVPQKAMDKIKSYVS